MQDAPTAPSCKSSEPKHESVRCLARLSALHRPSGADPQGSFLQKTVRQSIPESALRLRSNRPRGPWSRKGPFQEWIESRLDSYKEKSNRLVYILQALPPLSSPPTMGLGLGRGRYAIGQRTGDATVAHVVDVQVDARDDVLHLVLAARYAVLHYGEPPEHGHAHVIRHRTDGI